ncbi:YncE family protein [Flavivirga rizhaonensis]|nr:YncE family protein [Flavivirga rizhaonensis]
MRKGIYIGLATLTVISIGTVLFIKSKKKKKKDIETNSIKKVIQGKEDNFMSARSSSEHKTPEFKKSLHRWGTKQGVIDVAYPSVKHQNTSKHKSLLERWGTEEGIIDVADDKTRHGNTSEQNTLTYKKLLHQWGTEQGIIDVADHETKYKNSSKQKTPTYKKSLLRWGTKEGVIDVALETTKRQKTKKLNAIKITGDSITKSHQIDPEKKDNSENLNDYYKILQNDFDVTQVTVKNSSNEERTIKLWNASTNEPITEEFPTDIDVTQFEKNSVEVGVHPQGVISNPANGFIYVANQLSDSVSVLDINGNTITTIQLDAIDLPGSTSPVAITVNTIQSSSNYGLIYVVGSVSNTVTIIGLNHEIVTVINVGIRPLDIAFNPINEYIYVANFLSDTISVIDINGIIVDSILPVSKPVNMAINYENGDVFIINSGNDSVGVFNKDHVLIIQLNYGFKLGSIVYHPITKNMYASALIFGTILVINPYDFQDESINVGNQPYGITYNAKSQLLYVGNRADETYSIINSENVVIDTLNYSDINIGLASHTTENFIFNTDTSKNLLHLIGFRYETNISVNEEYYESQENFQHNPAILKHLKVIASGEERFKVLQLLDASISGKQSCKSLSFGNYHNPKNFDNISEVFDIEGVVIDRKHGWCFKIASNQTISLLLYYKQFEMYNLLPEKSRKSFGVKMSKGIPKSWLKTKQEPSKL